MTTKKGVASDLLNDDDDTGNVSEENKDSGDTDAKLPPEPKPRVSKDDAPVASGAPLMKLPDRRGKKARENEKLFASLGISRKYIPPITRKRSAIYQMLNFKGTRDRRLMEERDQYVDPYPLQMVPSYTFVDNEWPDMMQREKTMTYYEGGSEIVYTKDATGKSVPMSVAKIGAPEFVGGQKVINIYEEFSRFVWFELHPRNLSNKWRDKRLTPLFERVDTKFEGPHVQNIKLDFRLDAEKYVLSLKPDQMINLAAALTNPTQPTNINPQDLKFALRIRAQNNPEEILYQKPDGLGTIKIAAIHALDLGILTFVPEHDAYYYGSEEEPMCRVAIQQNPFDYLCLWLSGPEGEDYLKVIREDLSFWF